MPSIYRNIHIKCMPKGGRKFELKKVADLSLAAPNVNALLYRVAGERESFSVKGGRVIYLLKAY
jgi:hypothetical protein